MMKKLLFIAVLATLTGCATSNSNQKIPGSTPGASLSRSDSVILTSEGSGMVGDEIAYRGMTIENDSFDIPVEMNRSVEKWIDYFTGKGRENFAHYLQRSEYFIPFLKPILRNAKAPEDLVYLAMIESGFNNNARSHARAVGAWQFISATGRRYGLDINWWMDERRDVEKSTIAAVQYLKELNSMYGSWYLAWASYNAGEAKIGRAIKKYKTSNFWELCTAGKYLRPETKNYVPKLIAAAIIAKNRKQFGFEEHYARVRNVNAGMIAEKAEEGSVERMPDTLDGDSPGVTEPSIELTKDSPPDAEEESIVARDSVETMLLDMSNKTPHVNRKGEVNGDELAEIEVPSPADLFKVASAAGLSYTEFKSMNPELLRWVTPPYFKTYKLRIPMSRRDVFEKRYFDSSFNKDVQFLTYKARRGETAKHIARRFGINADPVAQMNGVSSPNVYFPAGRMVQLPIPSDFVRSVASLKSLDLIDPSYPRRARMRRAKVRRGKSSSAHFQNRSQKRI